MKAVEILLARDCAFRDSARAWQTPGRSLADSRKPGRLRKGTIINWGLIIPFRGYFDATAPQQSSDDTNNARTVCNCNDNNKTRYKNTWKTTSTACVQ